MGMLAGEGSTYDVALAGILEGPTFQSEHAQAVVVAVLVHEEMPIEIHQPQVDSQSAAVSRRGVQHNEEQQQMVQNQEAVEGGAMQHQWALQIPS